MARKRIDVVNTDQQFSLEIPGLSDLVVRQVVTPEDRLDPETGKAKPRSGPAKTTAAERKVMRQRVSVRLPATSSWTDDRD